MLSTQSSYEWNTTNLAAGRMPAASSTRLSGTPVHWPMAVQPSSQVCRVICVRDAQLFQLGERERARRGHAPSTDSRQSANAPHSSRR